ncbi:hypothetical protein, partial [Mucilaginibacter humi]|uniref:hypothetical protein n=1 Tax=Mucilaginibacter humi TaxID=2732510 RepID=UPI001C2DFC48
CPLGNILESLTTAIIRSQEAAIAPRVNHFLELQRNCVLITARPLLRRLKTHYRNCLPEKLGKTGSAFG